MPAILVHRIYFSILTISIFATATIDSQTVKPVKANFKVKNRE